MKGTRDCRRQAKSVADEVGEDVMGLVGRVWWTGSSRTRSSIIVL